MPESARKALLELAAAVADGARPEWESVGSPENAQHIIRGLQAIERIVQAGSHGSAQSGDVLDSILSARATATGIESPPITWGPLQVIEKIGRGSFGDVYRAFEPRLVREVALKLLRHRNGAEAEGDDVAIAEGHRLARVRHPNVVTVYGAERVGQRVGIWMELLPGPTLEEELRSRGPLPVFEAARIVRDMADALAAVHAAGLIHRDVKAQNIMRASDGRMVLTDFGTGQEVTLANDPITTHLAGTPLYLAPEVLFGGAATPQSDVYSLGVLLYHLLTNSFPVVGASLEDIRTMHTQSTPVRVLLTRPDSPRELVAIIDRALASRPEARFNDVEEMQAHLTSFLQSTAASIAARQVRLAVRRSLGKVVWIGGLFTGLMGGIGYVRFQQADARLVLVSRAEERATRFFHTTSLSLPRPFLGVFRHDLFSNEWSDSFRTEPDVRAVCLYDGDSEAPPLIAELALPPDLDQPTGFDRCPKGAPAPGVTWAVNRLQVVTDSVDFSGTLLQRITIDQLNEWPQWAAFVLSLFALCWISAGVAVLYPGVVRGRRGPPAATAR